MSGINIGKIGNKKVVITWHARERFKKRNLSHNEAVEALKKIDVRYPKNECGLQKVKASVTKSKRIFLVIKETKKKITIITGGRENDSP